MKKLICILTITLLFIFSCKKKDPSLVGYSKIRITSISGIGDFVYKDDKLLSVGNEILIYDHQGKLIGNRLSKIDTMVRLDSTIIKQSEIGLYIWGNNKIKGRVLDTLLSSITHINQNPSSLINPSWSLTTNYLANKYFYTAERLDSISNFGYSNIQTSYNELFIYNNDGEIIKIKTKFPNSQGPFPYHPISRNYDTEIEYDTHPNPFNLIYQETGVILNNLKDFNFSIHNPVKRKVTISDNGTPLEIINYIYYEYNNSGLPVKIIFNRGNYGERTYIIKYQ